MPAILLGYRKRKLVLFRLRSFAFLVRTFAAALEALVAIARRSSAVRDLASQIQREDAVDMSKVRETLEAVRTLYIGKWLSQTINCSASSSSERACGGCGCHGCGRRASALVGGY
jgi:hypothetical protein